jgi:hypothetical protein
MSNHLAERCKTIANFSLIASAEFKTSCSIPMTLLGGEKIPKEYVSGDEKPSLYADVWRIKTTSGIIYFLCEISITKEQFYSSIKNSLKKIEKHTCNVKNQSFFVTPWSKKITGVSEKNIITKIPELLMKSEFKSMSLYLRGEADLSTHTIITPSFTDNAITKRVSDEINILQRTETPSITNYLGEDDIEWDVAYGVKGGYTGGNVFVGRTYTPPPIKTYQFMKISCGNKPTVEIVNIEKENVLEISEIFPLLYGAN